MLAGTPRIAGDESGSIVIGTTQIVGGTSGSVLFNNTNLITEDNANFFWDDTNNILSIGSATPSTAAGFAPLQVLNADGAVVIKSIFSGSVNGVAGATEFANNATSATNFAAMCRLTSSGTNIGILRFASTTNSGSNAVGIIDSRNGTGTTSARPLLSFNSVGVTYLAFNRSGKWVATPAAISTTATGAFVFQPAADTNQTLSTEIVDFDVDFATNTKQWSTGAITTQRSAMFRAPNYSFFGASTITTAVTLFVASPIAGTNATITNSYAGYFQASAITGASESIARFDVSDNTGFIVFENGTGTDAAFSGTLRMTNSTTGLAAQFIGQGTTDTGSTEVVRFRSRIGTSTTVATRPAYVWENGSTAIMTILGSGATPANKLLVGDLAATPVGYSATSTRNIEVTRATTSAGYVVNTFSATVANGGVLEFNRGKASSVGSMTVVVAGDSLGSILFNGSDGTNFIAAAAIAATVGTGTVGTNDMPGALTLSTTLDGAAAVTERMRISARGNVLLSLGAIAEPSTSVGTLVLTNTATAPTTSVDVVSLFSTDVAGAGTASLAMFTEQAVATETVVSDRTLLVSINGTAYKICLKV